LTADLQSGGREPVTSTNAFLGGFVAVQLPCAYSLGGSDRRSRRRLARFIDRTQSLELARTLVRLVS
jgi:hypothetical protein